MFDNGLDIDEILEKKAVQSVCTDVDKCLNKSQKLHDWLNSLQKLAGPDAIVQYKIFKGTDREEWLTWYGQQQQQQQDNMHKLECNKKVKIQQVAEQRQFNF